LHIHPYLPISQAIAAVAGFPHFQKGNLSTSFGALFQITNSSYLMQFRNLIRNFVDFHSTVLFNRITPTLAILLDMSPLPTRRIVQYRPVGPNYLGVSECSHVLASNQSGCSHPKIIRGS